MENAMFKNFFTKNSRIGRINTLFDHVQRLFRLMRTARWLSQTEGSGLSSNSQPPTRDTSCKKMALPDYAAECTPDASPRNTISQVYQCMWAFAVLRGLLAGRQLLAFVRRE